MHRNLPQRPTSPPVADGNHGLSPAAAAEACTHQASDIAHRRWGGNSPLSADGMGAAGSAIALELYPVQRVVRLLTRSLLLRAAAERRLTAEGELLDAVQALVPHATGTDVLRALEALVEEDGRAGRPLLPALVTDDSRARPWPGLLEALTRFRRPLPQEGLEDRLLRATTERLAALEFYHRGKPRVTDWTE